MNRIIIAQIISSSWSKRFRGGAGASARNGVPERLALPALPELPDAPVVSIAHGMAYGEYNTFSAPVWEKLVCHAGVFTPLTSVLGLQPAGDDDSRLRLVFESPDPVGSEQWGFVDLHVGAPSRIAPRSPFALRCGEWGQVRYLGRWSKRFDGYAHYEKCVCNVGWLPADRLLSPHLFLETQMSRRYDSLPDVW